MSGIRRACSSRLQDLSEEESRKDKKGKKRNGGKKRNFRACCRYWASFAVCSLPYCS